MKYNYFDAIRWIDDQLTNPTQEIKIGCETIHDLNYSLQINRYHMLMNSNQLSTSSYERTKRIANFLQKQK